MSRNKLFGGLTTLLTITILLAIHQGNIQAATGRNSDYSVLSAHGGYETAGRGVIRTATDLDGYAPGNCAHCHEQHASINSSNDIPSDRLLFDTLVGNALCNTCHNGGTVNAKDINNQITKAYGHDPTINWGGSADELPTCDKCHNSHEARLGSHSEAVDGNIVDPSASNPATSGPLVSVVGQQITSWGGFTDPLAGNEEFSSITFAPTPTTVTEEWQLCFKCHANNKLSNKLVLDVGDQFNPNNHSVHPVTTTGNQWNNNHLRTNQLAAFTTSSPWDTAPVDSKMYCSDCHGSDNPGIDPEGPHGSANEFLLKATGPNTGLDNLCQRCHRPQNSSNFTDSIGWASPNLDGRIGDHSSAPHIPPANPDGCISCHGGIADTSIAPAIKSDIHGANYTWPDPDGGGPLTPLGSQAFIAPGGNRGAAAKVTAHYTDPAITGSRYCASTCHTGGVAYRYQ